MDKIQKFALFTFCLVALVACGEQEFRETAHYNGIRKTRVAYRDGKPDGEFKRWTSHGDLAESGFYKKGKREGEWTEWYSNGKVQERGIYQGGKKEGLWKGFFRDGKPSSERTFQDGEPTGTWTEFYPNGNTGERNSCFPKNAVGTRETFAASGTTIRKEHCKNGIPEGIVETFYPGGALESRSEYHTGKLHGKSELFRATGELWKRSFYRDDVRDSVWTYFAKDGSIERQSVFRNGNGIAYGEIGDGGIDAETTFVDNKVQDTLRYTLPGRTLHYVEVWKDDEKQKLLSFYDSTKVLASEGNFLGGKPGGSWRNWYPDGTLKDSLFYKDGEPFGEQLHYDSTGKLYMRKVQYGKRGPMQVGFE